MTDPSQNDCPQVERKLRCVPSAIIRARHHLPRTTTQPVLAAPRCCWSFSPTIGEPTSYLRSSHAVATTSQRRRHRCQPLGKLDRRDRAAGVVSFSKSSRIDGHQDHTSPATCKHQRRHEAPSSQSVQLSSTALVLQLAIIGVIIGGSARSLCLPGRMVRAARSGSAAVIDTFEKVNGEFSRLPSCNASRAFVSVAISRKQRQWGQDSHGPRSFRQGASP